MSDAGTQYLSITVGQTRCNTGTNAKDLPAHRHSQVSGQIQQMMEWNLSRIAFGEPCLMQANYRPPPNQHRSVPGKATNATRLGVVPAESLFSF